MSNHPTPSLEWTLEFLALREEESRLQGNTEDQANYHNAARLIRAGREPAEREPQWHGCATGDCPHDNVNDCVKVMAVQVEESAEREADLQRKLEEVGAGYVKLRVESAERERELEAERNALAERIRALEALGAEMKQHSRSPKMSYFSRPAPGDFWERLDTALARTEPEVNPWSERAIEAVNATRFKRLPFEAGPCDLHDQPLPGDTFCEECGSSEDGCGHGNPKGAAWWDNRPAAPDGPLTCVSCDDTVGPFTAGHNHPGPFCPSCKFVDDEERLDEEAARTEPAAPGKCPVHPIGEPRCNADTIEGSRFCTDHTAPEIQNDH